MPPPTTTTTTTTITTTTSTSSPPPLPPPPAATTLPLPLPHRINAATRPLHARLNALISAALPLALPPHAQDPALYAVGMASFVPVYEAFEAGVRGVGVGVRVGEGEGRGGSGGGGDGGVDGGGEGVGEELRVIQGLRRLYMRPLERGARLRDDVEGIWVSMEKGKGKRRRSGSAIEHLQQRRPRLEAFTDHIRSVAAVPAKRHLLLAYAWVLYMALFSGGRYIRARLRGAGAGFWDKGVEGERGLGDDEKEAGVDGYLGFWTFEGEEDGEDLKAEFKDRFASVEGILTEAEKEEVVQEAVFIMQSMIDVVVEISELFGTGLSEAAAGGRTVDDETVDGRVHDEPSMQWLLLKHVLPMGMVELIAAGARSAASVGMGTSFWSTRAK